MDNDLIIILSVKIGVVVVVCAIVSMLLYCNKNKKRAVNGV